MSRHNTLRYTKNNVVNSFKLLCKLCAKQEYQSHSDPEKIGKWRLAHSFAVGYTVEEIYNEAGGITHPLGHTYYSAREFCEMVNVIWNLTLNGVFVTSIVNFENRR